MRSRLIEKQVKDLRCPAAVMRSRPPIRHWETGKAGEDEDAEPEELPHWNAVSSLRETGRRDDIFILYAFLPESKKAFCFVATVTIRRFPPDLPMVLLETKCGCTHSDIVSINVSL